MAKLRIGNRVIRIGAAGGIVIRRKVFNLAPSIPSGLDTSNVADTTMTISWNASTDDVAVSGYEYRINGGAAIDVGNALTANLSGLIAGTGYSLQVRAYDAESAFSAWSIALDETTTSSNLAPSVPSGLVTSNVADTTMTISWNASTDDVAVTGYEYRVNGGVAVDVGNVLTASLSGLVAGTGYSLQVRAYDAESAFSAWSAAVNETTTGGAVSNNYNVGYIENPSAPEPMLVSDTGTKGVSTWATATNNYTDINGNTFTVIPIQESTLLADVSGTLANIDILFTGSAIGDYTGTPASELESWIKSPLPGNKTGRRVFACCSDGSALGGGADNGVGQVSRQSMGIMDWAGFDQARDQKQGTQTHDIPAGSFIAQGMTTRIIESEGMSPFVMDSDSSNHASQGYPTIIIERTQSLPKPEGLVFTGTIADLCYSQPGAGLFLGLPDRQLFLNGPNTGSDYNQQENSLLLTNVLLCGTGVISPSAIDTTTSFTIPPASLFEQARIGAVKSWGIEASQFATGPIFENDWKRELPEFQDIKFNAQNHMQQAYGDATKDPITGEQTPTWKVNDYIVICDPASPGVDPWNDKIQFKYAPGFVHAATGNLSLVEREFMLPDVDSTYGPWNSFEHGKMFNGVVLTSGTPVPPGSNPFTDDQFEYSSSMYFGSVSQENGKGDFYLSQWPADHPGIDPNKRTYWGTAVYGHDVRMGVVGHNYQEEFWYCDLPTNKRHVLRRGVWITVEEVCILSENGNNGTIAVRLKYEDEDFWRYMRYITDLDMRGNGTSLLRAGGLIFYYGGGAQNTENRSVRIRKMGTYLKNV